MLSNDNLYQFKRFIFGRYHYFVEKYSVTCVHMTKYGTHAIIIRLWFKTDYLCLTMALYVLSNIKIMVKAISPLK